MNKSFLKLKEIHKDWYNKLKRILNLKKTKKKKTIIYIYIYIYIKIYIMEKYVKCQFQTFFYARGKYKIMLAQIKY